MKRNVLKTKLGLLGWNDSKFIGLGQFKIFWNFNFIIFENSNSLISNFKIQILQKNFERSQI